MRKKATLDLLDADEGLADVLFARITTEDEQPHEICAAMGLAWGAVLAWCNEDEERIRKLKDALAIRAHLLAERGLAIADEVAEDKDAIAKAKLQVDTRKWLAGRLNPKWFGERQEVEHTGTIGLIALLSSLPRGGIEQTSLEKIPAEIPAVDLEPVESGGAAPPVYVPRVSSSEETPEQERI